MDILDFVIGLTLMKAMPHFILGVWNRKMWSPFGQGKTENILYALLLVVLSLSLYILKYGFQDVMSKGIYLGAVATLIVYFVFAPLVYRSVGGSRNKPWD